MVFVGAAVLGNGSLFPGVEHPYVQPTGITGVNRGESFNPSAAVLPDPGFGCHLHVVLGHTHRHAPPLFADDPE